VARKIFFAFGSTAVSIRNPCHLLGNAAKFGFLDAPAWLYLAVMQS
jgi:hypothetical protein